MGLEKEVGGGVAVCSPHQISAELLSRVLTPYFPHCRYLVCAHLEVPPVYDQNNGNGTAGKRSKGIQAHGAFTIERSCYGNNTGHFNAAEFIICFNQLAYSMIAQSIILGHMAELGLEGLEGFQAAQLQGILIGRVRELSFKRQINPKRFTGSVRIENVIARGGTTFYSLGGNFKDDVDGYSAGEMTIAIQGRQRVSALAS